MEVGHSFRGALCSQVQLHGSSASSHPPCNHLGRCHAYSGLGLGHRTFWPGKDWVTAAAPVIAQQPRTCGVKDCEVTENWFAFPIMLVVVEKSTYALRAMQPMRGSPFPPACADVLSSPAGPSCVCVGRTKDCFAVAHIPLQWQEFTDTL